MSFEYMHNTLHWRSPAGQYDLLGLCQKMDQPFYFYDLDAMVLRLQAYQEAMPKNTRVHYAMKANDNPLVLKAFAHLGVGVDVVSGGEIRLALECGFSADKIVFSGVGKSKKEISLAIEKGVAQLNVESPSELRRIGELAAAAGKKVSVALRMNPDVNPETHPYITTGFRDNKFGMDKSFLSELDEILQRYPEHLHLCGLTIHIGSQIKEITPFREAIEKTLPIYDQLNEMGYSLDSFDVGGGIGIEYSGLKGGGEAEYERLTEYGQMIQKALGGRVEQILCEPGRFIVGPFGLLMTEVQYLKKTPYKKFVIVNTGMHHLMRPALYQAHHEVFSLRPRAGDKILYEIVGPICESADVIARDRMMNEVCEGDWLAVGDAGAYGRVMASGYNAHELPLEFVGFEGRVQDSQGREV